MYICKLLNLVPIYTEKKQGERIIEDKLKISVKNAL